MATALRGHAPPDMPIQRDGQGTHQFAIDGKRGNAIAKPALEQASQ
jgi:hypothetical protein